VIVHCLQESMDERLARALRNFETEFRYPLGGGAWFEISHAPDYLRFYQSIGRAACFVAEDSGRVRGTISVAIKRALAPDSSSMELAYFGDLKVVPGAGRGLIAARLLQASSRWALERVSVAIAVAMDGTSALPLAYTGRLGIPPLIELHRIAILRIPSRADATTSNLNTTSREKLDNVYQELTRGTFASISGDSSLRSMLTPLPLVSDSGDACGLLEDTRQAKQLHTVGGDEMVSAHLSCLAFRNCLTGAELIRHAQRLCGQLGYPALFLSTETRFVDELLDRLDLASSVAASSVTRTSAMLFGYGFPANVPWRWHTSEI